MPFATFTFFLLSLKWFKELAKWLLFAPLIYWHWLGKCTHIKFIYVRVFRSILLFINISVWNVCACLHLNDPWMHTCVTFPHRIFLSFWIRFLLGLSVCCFNSYLWDFYWFALFLRKTQTRFMTVEDEKWKMRHVREGEKRTLFLPGRRVNNSFCGFSIKRITFHFPVQFFLSLSRSLFLLIIWQPSASKFISISLLNTNARWVSLFLLC